MVQIARQASRVHARLRDLRQARVVVPRAAAGSQRVGQVARIKPQDLANKLPPTRCERLADMVRATLADALTSGRQHAADYVCATGEPGAY